MRDEGRYLDDPPRGCLGLLERALAVPFWFLSVLLFFGWLGLNGLAWAVGALGRLLGKPHWVKWADENEIGLWPL